MLCHGRKRGDEPLFLPVSRILPRGWRDLHGRLVEDALDGRVEVLIGIEWLPLASGDLLRNARTLADELGTGIPADNTR